MVDINKDFVDEEHEFESEEIVDDYEGDMWDDDSFDDDEETEERPAWISYAMYAGIALIIILGIVLVRTLLSGGGSEQDPNGVVDVPGTEQIVEDTTVDTAEAESIEETTVAEDEEEETSEEVVYDNPLPDETMEPSKDTPALEAASKMMGDAAKASDADRALTYDTFATQIQTIEKGIKEGGTVSLKFDNKSAVDRLAFFIQNGYKIVPESFHVYEGLSTDSIRFIVALTREDSTDDMKSLTGVYNKDSDSFTIESVMSASSLSELLSGERIEVPAE